MDNGLQALLTLLSILTAVVQVTSEFYNVTTPFMRRKLLSERFASGVSSSRFEEGKGHKTEYFPLLLIGYFVLHNYYKIHKDTLNNQKHKCSQVQQSYEEKRVRRVDQMH